jgi:hypothetical protein
MSKLIEAAVAELDKYVDQYKINEELDYGESDEGEKHHQDHASKNWDKPTHSWPDGDTVHKIWHTTHKGKPSTLHHQSDHNSSDDTVMRFHQAGHHSPEAVKKTLKDYE